MHVSSAGNELVLNIKNLQWVRQYHIYQFIKGLFMCGSCRIELVQLMRKWGAHITMDVEAVG